MLGCLDGWQRGITVHYQYHPLPYHAGWHLIKEDLKTEKRIHISGEKNYVKEGNKKELKGGGQEKHP